MSMGDTNRFVAIVGEQLGQDVVLCGAEVGVSRGALSAQLLTAFPSLFLHMIDAWTVYEPDHPYRKSGDGCAKLSMDQQEENMAAADAATKFAAHRRLILRKTSEEAAARHTQPLDFVFLDGDHTYSAVARDIEIWHPHVRPGGIVAGHDLGSPRDVRGQWGVTKAVMEWQKKTGAQVSLDGTCWWYRK